MRGTACHAGPMSLTLRREAVTDHRVVEALAREAFWGMTGPRCNEHLLAHRLRTTPAFVPELDYVAEVDGRLVGNVMYSRARVVGERGAHDVLTFGPLSVLPTHQGTGVGSALMRRTLAEAAALGHRAVIVYGHPDYYPRLGFRRAAEVGITAPDGSTFDALMALALVPGGLDGVTGQFHEDPVFHLDPDDVAEFEQSFPAKGPALLTAVGTLDGRVAPVVVGALRSHGVTHLEDLRQRSRAEVAAWDGVDDAACGALRAVLREHGVVWG